MHPKRLVFLRILVNAAIALAITTLLLANAPIACAQSTVYAITNTGVFGTLNLSSGTFTQLGSSGIEPVGMAELGGDLFTETPASGTLFLVNPSNGNLTTVGSGAAGLYCFGATTAALYGCGTDNNLYSVNPATGASTLIGSTGLILRGGYTVAMSSNAGPLYLALDTGGGSILYSFNLNTGAATPIGNTGLRYVDSMVYANGLLYAALYNGTLYTLNTNTGAATFVANTGQILWGMGKIVGPCALPIPACQ